MPPFLTWFVGREAVVRFVASEVFGTPDAWRMVPTSANGQPAVAVYRRGRDGVHRAYAIQVLTVTAAGIAWK